MGYWGWRPLICGLFISTWVAGCNIATDNAASSPSAPPSAYPNVTLTVGRLPTARVSAAPTRAAPTRVVASASSPTPAHYVVQPGDDWAAIAQHFGVSLEALHSANSEAATLTPGQTLVIPLPTPPPLLVYPPTCYETRPNNLLCLGRVDNLLDYPVESVAIEVRLVGVDGAVFLSGSTLVEQASIPSGSFAPYQATFEAESGTIASADASLISSTRGEEDRFVSLQIEEVTGELRDGRILVSASVYNAGPRDAEILRVFVTLLDGAQRVIGYRVVTFDETVMLGAGARLPLNVEVTPQVLEATPEYALYVEARPAEE
ncbi:MAG: LysM peptidoglycan-binding domain-containing protein [Anaerolineae bacterium]|nr:LysM peptidoglycan-binding domain-containing protein [Anaerolineae bacterium]